MASKSVINVKILGDNKGLKASLDDSSSKIGNFVKTAGKSAAAVGISLGVAAVKGIAAFADFEKSMNEVFTLLPGISAEAMDDMSGQVKEFSKKFGVLPEETIPALYQALSAGVPEGNVFDFMETAQKAAKGGVTDLTTAVDGISSVVNAYGDEIISAAEASDLMFTTVRLGKTTFEEISASISNITPISSALGVGFDEVSAALAVLTSKGVPTAGATTQIKGALAELGKEGTIADKAFQAMTGGGFQDFIDQGGTMGDAFQLIADGAEASDKSVLDMFGSVEAGQAVLALTANGGEAFTDVMGEMSKSAGATEDAFDTMDGGLASAFDKIKATFAVILIEIGEKLAPTIQKAADWITENSERISAAFDRAMAFLGDAIDIGVAAISTLVEFVRRNFPTVREAIEDVFDWLTGTAWPAVKPVFEAIGDAAEEVATFFVDNWPKALEAARGVFDFLKKNKDEVIGALAALGVVLLVSVVAPLLAAAAAAIVAAAPFVALVAVVAAIGAALVYAYQNFEPFRNAVDAVVQYLMNDAWPMIQMVAAEIVKAFDAVVAWFKMIWPDILTVVSFVVDAVKKYIEIWVATVTKIWETFGDTILQYVADVWDFIQSYIDGVIKAVRGVIQTVTALIKGDWSGVWEGIKTILSGVWDGIKAVVQLAIDIVKGAINIGLDAIKVAWFAVWGAVSGFADDIWEDIKGFASSGIDAVVGFVTSLPGRIASGVAGAFDSIYDGFKGVINRVIDAWNGLSLPGFTIGGWDPPGPGPSFPSLTIPSVGTPNIPRLHSGGVVPGLPGTDQVTMLQAGERVSSIGDSRATEPDWKAVAREMAREYARTLQQERRAA